MTWNIPHQSHNIFLLIMLTLKKVSEKNNSKLNIGVTVQQLMCQKYKCKIWKCLLYTHLTNNDHYWYTIYILINYIINSKNYMRISIVRNKLNKQVIFSWCAIDFTELENVNFKISSV